MFSSNRRCRVHYFALYGAVDLPAATRGAGVEGRAVNYAVNYALVANVEGLVVLLSSCRK